MPPFQMPRFQSVVPALPETFAFRNHAPCQLEEPSQPSTGGQEAPSKLPCPFKDVCDRASGRLALFLHAAYGFRIKVTLAEASSSIVARSEHQYNKAERRRLSLRKHLYELNRDEPLQVVVSRGAIEAIIAEMERYEMLAENNQDGRGRSFTETVRDATRDALHRQLARGREDQITDIAGFSNELEARLTTAGMDPEGWRLFRYTLVVQHLAAPLRCRRIDGADSFGKYLGFVDLRLHSVRSPLAMGLLAPPRWLRHDRTAFVITGEYGPIFGGPGFAGTVYCMHDPDEGGGHCAQASIIMVLGFLSDRGALVAGSFTITYLGKRKYPLTTQPEEGTSRSPATAAGPEPRCLALERDVTQKFAISGMLPSEICDVLTTQGFRTTATHVTLGSEFDDHYAKRLIEAYIYARCPVILLVCTNPWYPSHRDAGLAGVGHAVVIIGVRQAPLGATCAPQPVVTHLIVHDPGYAPFCERTIDDALRASRAYAGAGYVSLIPVGDENIKRHAHECLELLALSSYPQDQELYARYIRGAGNGAATDFRVSRLHRDDISRTIRECVRPTADGMDELNRRCQKLMNQWYWCVAGFAQKELDVIWVFEADKKLYIDADKVVRPWLLRTTSGKTYTTDPQRPHSP